LSAKLNNSSREEKIIPDWTVIRKIIIGIGVPEIRNILQISYLFGTRLQELVRGRTRQEPIKGNDFYETTIAGEEAIVLEIPTARRGWKPRKVAIPLSPKHEPWAKEVLYFSEEKAEKPIYPKVSRVLQNKIKGFFKYLEWPTPMYKRKKEMRVNIVELTIKHLPEIREWELGLCHNFNEYDFKNFFGKEYDSNYEIYFDKLLKKSDFFYTEDIIRAIELKNVVFNPSSSEKFYYKEYMDVVKKIKRKFILEESLKELIINPNISIENSSGRESKEHHILKANAKNILSSESNNISYEEANFDVVDLDNGVVIECGHTSARKLLDSFNDVYENIKEINEFLILQFYDSNFKSDCYKFIKSNSYK